MSAHPVKSLTLRFAGQPIAAVKVRYDPEADAWYVRVRAGRASRTVEHEAGRVYVDLDAEGRLLGFEMLGDVRTGTIRVIGDRYVEAGAREQFSMIERAVAAVA